MKPKNKKSFTLIELLIVIALIGILAGIGIFTYDEAQKKARDAQRKNDLQNVIKAMYLAKADCNNGAFVPAGGPYGHYRHYTSTLEYLKYNGYIDSIPMDPKGPKYDPSAVDGVYDNEEYIYVYLDFEHTKPSNFCGRHPDGTSTWWSAVQSNTLFIAKMERAGKDPDTVKSWNDCQGAIKINKTITYLNDNPDDRLDMPNDYYFVCM